MERIENIEYFKTVISEEGESTEVLDYTMKYTYDDVEVIVDEVPTIQSTLLKEEKIINDEVGTCFEIIRQGKIKCTIQTYPVIDNKILSENERFAKMDEEIQVNYNRGLESLGVI